ncbi:MAG TPA: sugar-binding protein, partial [Propionicimonas sp.]|nr:sugar-binding protein [Propionicimonas sp.]
TQVAPSPRPVPVEPVPTEPIQTVPVPMEPIQTGSLEVPADIYRVDSPGTPPVWPGAALGAPAGASAPHGPGPAPVPTPNTARMQAQPAPPTWALPPAMAGPAGVPGATQPQPQPQPQRKRRGPWVALGVAGLAVITFIGWALSLGPGDDIVPTPTDPVSSAPVVDPAVLVAVAGTATIDGVADEWAASTYFHSDQVVFGNDTGVRGRTQLMWDENALYFLTEVTDGDLQLPDPDEPSKVFTGDAVSLELGADSSGLDMDEKLRPLDRHFLFGIAESSTGVVIGANRPNGKLTVFSAGGTPDDVTAHAAQTTDGYLIEGMIPWSATGLDGIGSDTRLAANVNVSDRNPESVGKLACMVSTNPERTAQTQPHPAYWQELLLQG